jgi:hypothetical protein
MLYFGLRVVSSISTQGEQGEVRVMRHGDQKCRSPSKDDIELACINRARAEDTVVDTPSGVKGLQSQAKPSCGCEAEGTWMR